MYLTNTRDARVIKNDISLNSIQYIAMVDSFCTDYVDKDAVS
jgi:hypothetical protein